MRQNIKMFKIDKKSKTKKKAVVWQPVATVFEVLADWVKRIDQI